MTPPLRIVCLTCLALALLCPLYRAHADNEKLRIYFIGNSLSRGLTLADRSGSRMCDLLGATGFDLEYGSQLAGGANLDDHWALKRLFSGNDLKLNFCEPLGTINNMDNESATTVLRDISTSKYRNYTHALQGAPETEKNIVWDAVVLQPYQSFVEQAEYQEPNKAGYLGDRKAIENLIAYARGQNPVRHVAAESFFIYSAWPRLDGIERAAVDLDKDGFYTFHEFNSSAYLPDGRDPSRSVPTRESVSRLMAAISPAHANYRVRLIPVGEVLSVLDKKIIAGELPGIESYFKRNENYYLKARLDGKPDLEQAKFTFFYHNPADRPKSYSRSEFEFVPAHGVKNFYTDRIHMNAPPHSGPDAGTMGAYVAAATVAACITGVPPSKVKPGQVAAIYEKFDPITDVELIKALQQTIWEVVTSPAPLAAGGPPLHKLTGANESTKAYP